MMASHQYQRKLIQLRHRPMYLFHKQRFPLSLFVLQLVVHISTGALAKDNFINEPLNFSPRNLRRGHQPFGTLSGYDSDGGSDPICWISYVNETKTREGFISQSDTLMENEAFDELMSELYEEERQAVMEDNCWSNVNLTVKAPEGDIFHTDADYIFKIRLKLNQDTLPDTGINSTHDSMISPANRVWFRLLLCDSQKTGFCHPFIHMEPHDNSQSDSSDQSQNSPNDNNYDKYKLNPGETILAKTSGSNLYSPFVKKTLLNIIHFESLDIPYRVPSAGKGSYFCIAHAVFFLADVDNPMIVKRRIDIAGAITNKFIVYSEPPTIHEVTIPLRCMLGIVLLICFLGESYLFASIIKHRKNPIMQLSQAPYLAILVLSCMVVTISCYFYIPSNDIFCNLNSILILIPLSLINAILVGRLWRISSLLSSVLNFGSKKVPSKLESSILWFLSSLTNWECVVSCFRRHPELKNGSLRNMVPNKQLVRLLVVLTLPQVLLQVVEISANPERLSVELNQAGTEGRKTCATDYQWKMLLGYAYVAFLYLLAVLLAWISKDLPSVFNETKSIFTCTLLNCLVALIGLSLVQFTNKPTTSPNIMVAIWSAVTLCLAIAPCWLIVVPKLRIIWKGKQVMLSNLLKRDISRKSFTENITDFNDTGDRLPDEDTNLSTIQEQSISGIQESDASIGNDLPLSTYPVSINSIPIDEGGMNVDDHEINGVHKRKQTQKVARFSEDEDPESNKPVFVKPTISDVEPHLVLKKFQAPPWKLELQMLTVNQLLTKVSNSCFEGTKLTKSDWERLQAESKKLAYLFDMLIIDWDEDKEKHREQSTNGIANNSRRKTQRPSLHKRASSAELFLNKNMNKKRTSKNTVNHRGSLHSSIHNV